MQGKNQFARFRILQTEADHCSSYFQSRKQPIHTPSLMGNLGAFIVLFCLLVEFRNCVPLSKKAPFPNQAVPLSKKAPFPDQAGGCRPFMDIAILADISRSMENDHRSQLIKVVHRLVDELGVSETGNHFGFVTFAVNATIHSNFSNPSYYNASNLKSKVDKTVRVRPDRDSTRIDLAMELMESKLFTSDGGDRPNARNTLLVFTDGRPVYINTTWDTRKERNLSKSAEALKEKNVTIWVVGIGKNAKTHGEDMNKIAGDNGHVTFFDNFEKLKEKFVDEFKKTFCDPQSTTAPPPPAKNDPMCPTDVAFILDSSNSIKDGDFNDEKEVVQKLLMDLDIAPDKNRAALVLFGTSPSLKARFGQYETADKFQDVLQKLPKMGDRTRIDKALNVAENQIFQDARQDVYKIAIILTDGLQSNGAQGLRPSSKPLRDAGVRVIAVGVGVGMRERRLRLMTDRDEDVVNTKNIQGHLQGILSDLSQNGCNLQTVPASNPGKCEDEPGYERECRQKAKDKSFCWDNPDFSSIYCQKSCELCPL